MHIDPQLIKDIKSNPYAILEKLSIKEIAQLLKQANHAYHQEGRPLFPDDTYEIIQAYLANLVPDHPLVQTDIIGSMPKKDKVKLPIFMGSLDKIKDDPVLLDRWKSKYQGEYVISDKLDGISCLVMQTKSQTILYSRGNGIYGQNISHLLKYIQGIPTDIPDGCTVRGELVITKKDWEKIKDKRTNPRNTVAGLANSKKPEKDIAQLVNFIAYECIQPLYKPSVGLSWMKKQGFNIVHNNIIKTLTTDKLSTFLIDRRKNSDFEVDGIVIAHNEIHEAPEDGNPEYAFAFKSVLTSEKAEVIVKDVIWNISKNALLKPVVLFDTVFIGGAHIKKATAHNASMIEKNNIGPGSRIVVIRSGDVIPYILEVLGPSSSGKPSFPSQIEYPWKWNDNHVELVLENPHMAEDYKIRQLENYANVLGIKGLGAKIIKKLYDIGIDSVKKLVNVTKIDLYKATYSSTLTMKIYKNLQAIYNKSTCVEFMAASNIFGGGFGKKKFQLVTEAFPDILSRKPPSLAELLNTKGIGERFARQFLEHLPDFYDFIEEVGLPCRSTLVPIEPTQDGFMSLYGKTIVFTGFRSKELEEYIIKHGGKVSSSVSKTTNIVVAKSVDDNSIKSETAKELEIPLMSQKVFSEEIGFVESPMVFDKEQADQELESLKEELEKEGLLEEEENESDDEEDDIGLSKTAECVRHAMNWANMKRPNVFGKSGYDVETVRAEIAKSSPKLETLIKKILSIDEQDLKKRGKLFKHVIFSDVTKRGFGAKIVAAGLDAFGFHHTYDGTFQIDHKDLLKTKNSNFAILAATQIYTKPISVEFKQQLLSTFNSRPKNTHGELIRIMVLDSGYKEGIDLFDIKYVHLYEPILTYADEMQAIGRSTRFCGQKGLPFVDGSGWKLHVFKYDHILSEQLAQEFSGHTSSLEMILGEMNKNRSIMELSKEIEKVCQSGAVDSKLTKSIHNLSKGGAIKKTLHKELSREDLEKYISDKYPHLKWKDVTMENLCNNQSTSKLLEFSPSQEFIRQYFQPSSPYKGLFLWHSLGSGKTCTAVGAASYTWEIEGYSILWITRGTLRSDVYKNMFDMSCLERIRDMIKTGYDIPQDMGKRKRLLSRSWLPPLSYRQFNNALKRQNRLYDFLIKRNGYSDPFRKTLIIIDEAHLMFSPSIKEKDKPDVNLLKAWLRNSYKISKENSARVLLMSATPITDNPFTFASLMNLTHHKDMPEDEEGFIKRYLDKDTLKFTDKGAELFKDDITGRLSYLNRMRDARQFAQPVIHTVTVPISEPNDLQIYVKEMQDLDSLISSLKEVKIGDTKKAMIEDIESAYERPMKDCDKLTTAAAKKACLTNLKKEMKEEKSKVDDQVRQKVQEAKFKVNKAKEDFKDVKKRMKEAKRNDGSILTVLRKRCYFKKQSQDEDDKDDKPTTTPTPKNS